MNRSEYIEYIREQRNRAAEENKSAGTTIWALVVALAYLIWQTIPMYSKIIHESQIIQATLINYSLLLISGIALYFLISNQWKEKKTDRFSNRFKKMKPIDGAFPLTIVLIGIPLISVFLSTPQRLDENHGGLISRIWFAEQIAASLAIFYTLLFYAEVKHKFHNRECPEFLTSLRSRPPALLFVANAAIIILIITNITTAFAILKQVPKELFTPSAMVSTNLAMAHLVVISFIIINHKKKRISAIEDLERDIVFHELPDSEIKQRIQEEIIGQEIGDWMRKRMHEVKEKSAGIIHCINAVESLRQGIEEKTGKALDKDLKRIKSLSREANKLQEEYTYKYQNINTWLRNVLKLARDQKNYRVTSVIEETLSDLDSIDEVTSIRWEKFSRNDGCKQEGNPT